MVGVTDIWYKPCPKCGAEVISDWQGENPDNLYLSCTKCSWSKTI